MKKMQNRSATVPLGAVLAEVMVLGGAKCAAEIAQRAGRAELAEKIRRGEFIAPRGGFNAARAQARAAAMALPEVAAVVRAKARAAAEALKAKAA